MRRFMLIGIPLLLGVFIQMKQAPQVKYLPLGDSYTICTGADESKSWPVLLSGHLKESGVNTVLLANPARNGFTTQNLIDKELPLVQKLKPDFITLLIGVNDWVQGESKEKFQKNLRYILGGIRTALPTCKVLLITIPDFGVTPQGRHYSGGRDISKGIQEFNEVIKDEARERNLKVVDIFPLSQNMKNDPDLVASDGLHPSAREYALWEKLIFPEALSLLKGEK